MRDRRVWLKTLGGLRPVDVVLRRVDDTFCDPLELREDSSLGVPGLVEAARAGNVTVANAFGSAAVEIPALMAFLPGLCRHLLHEELGCRASRPGGADNPPLDYTRAPGRLSHPPRFRIGGQRAVEASDPGRLRPRGSVERIRSARFDFVAQEQVRLSTAPVLVRGKLEARPVVLSAFVCATPTGFAVMPGGLTRFSGRSEQTAVSMQRGGASKDTWILSDGPVSQLTLLKPTPHVIRIERSAIEVTSRVGDNLYWVGRYTRTFGRPGPGVAMSVDAADRRSGRGRNPGSERAGEAAGEPGFIPAKISGRVSPGWSGTGNLPADLSKPSSGYGAGSSGTPAQSGLCVAGPFFCRYVEYSEPNPSDRSFADRVGPDAGEALALLNALVADLAAFSGMEMENMTRGQGWRLLDLGRRIERGITW